MRHTIRLVTLLLSLTSIVVAQNQPLTFEVATVKPSQPSTGFSISFALCHGTDTQLPVYPPGFPITVPALGRCLIKRWALTDVISFAYPLAAAAVLPAATHEQLLSMLRQLLAKLTVSSSNTTP